MGYTLNIVKANGTRVNAPVRKRYNWVINSALIEQTEENIPMDTSSLPVIHNQASHRFEVRVGTYLAELTYILKDDSMIFTHTGVPPALEGNGIGSLLVKTGIKYARNNALKVESLCWFVSKYIERHPESVE
jgi:predicted GNAT family acetyltransferase